MAGGRLGEPAVCRADRAEQETGERDPGLCPLPPEIQAKVDKKKQEIADRERRKREQIKGQMDIEDYEQFFKLRGEE